jgi:Uma2 family endonuclease
MVALTIDTTTRLPAGRLVATDVSAMVYLETYAETYHEWVRGMVLQMSPVSSQHDALTSYLRMLLTAYLELNPIATVLGAPFVMRLAATDSYREPDLQVIRHDNPGKLTDTAMLGPADIAIEVVSPESVARDYGDKFAEYEQGGVREYWLIDPIRQRCQFNRLNAAGVYASMAPDATGNYQTPLLPKLVVRVPTAPTCSHRWSPSPQGPTLSALMTATRTKHPPTPLTHRPSSSACSQSPMLNMLTSSKLAAMTMSNGGISMLRWPGCAVKIPPVA